MIFTYVDHKNHAESHLDKYVSVKSSYTLNIHSVWVNRLRSCTCAKVKASIKPKDLTDNTVFNAWITIHCHEKIKFTMLPPSNMTPVNHILYNCCWYKVKSGHNTLGGKKQSAHLCRHNLTNKFCKTFDWQQAKSMPSLLCTGVCQFSQF